MKKILLICSALIGMTVFAKTEKKRQPQQVIGQIGYVLHVDSNGKGKTSEKAPAFIGYEDICFTGEGKQAQAEVWKLMQEDNEKKSSFVKYIAKKDILVYGYIDTKCKDEGI
jgi:hypothetical protein